MTTENNNLEDKKTKKVTLNRQEGAELNDETRCKKRPARERLQILRTSGGKTRNGYVRRWVEDKRTNSVFGSNIKDREFLGYTVVENEDTDIHTMTGKPLGSVVEKFERNGSRMVLMEIPKEEYDEIQAAKQEALIKPLTGEGFYETAHIDVKHRIE